MFCNFPCWIWQQERPLPSTASEFSCKREHSLKKKQEAHKSSWSPTKCLNNRKKAGHYLNLHVNYERFDRSEIR